MSGWRRLVLGTVMVLLATACGAAVASAQPVTLRDRVAATALFGSFRPSQSAFRNVYAGRRMPVTLMGEGRVRGRIWLFGGLRMLRLDGETVAIGTSGSGEVIASNLEVTSVLLGARIRQPLGRLALAIGAGAARASYEERVDVLDTRVRDSAWGAVFDVQLEYPVAPHVAIAGRAAYLTLPTGVGSVLEPRVDLGGLDIGVGLTVRF